MNVRSGFLVDRHTFMALSGFPHLDPVSDPPLETDHMDPFALLREFPDITLEICRLQDGERGRWYPDTHVIMIDDRLSQAERRCTLMHELVHRSRGDSHMPDDVLSRRQESHCHRSAARALISFPSLLAALRFERDLQSTADELWVDVETLQARMDSLSRSERQALDDIGETDAEWGVA